MNIWSDVSDTIRRKKSSISMHFQNCLIIPFEKERSRERQQEDRYYKKDKVNMFILLWNPFNFLKDKRHV